MRIFTLCMLALAGVVGWVHIDARPPWAPFAMPAPAPEREHLSAKGKQQAMVEPQSFFIPETAAPSVHAASLIALADGKLRAFWFAGSREGAADVVIQSAVFDPQAAAWSQPTVVIDRVAAEKGLARYIAKLGNPLPVRASDGKLHLYFVTVSVGGWAGSSISWMESNDDGLSWSRPQRLITSPALNLSTLIKGPGFDFADQSLGLPVYHEWMGKFGELVRIEQGRVMDKRRMSSGRALLQPIVFIESPETAVAYFRQARSTGPKRIPSSHTRDAGQSWLIGGDLELSNPNAAIAGLQLANGDRIMAINDLEAARHRLVLVMAPAGSDDWSVIEVIESDDVLVNGLHREFSYPYLTLATSGDVHLVYTYDRKKIKHIQFDAQWLEMKKTQKGAL